MQWPLFLGYAAIVWLIFVKLKLIRLSLTLAIVLAAAGPILFFYVLYAMNFYHPGSSDVQVLRRVVQIAPRTSKPGRVAEVLARANAPMKKGDTLFNIDPQPFQFEVERLKASLAASQQGVPELKAALDQANASRQRAEAQTALAQQTYDRNVQLFSRNVVAQATVDSAKRDLDAAVQSEAGARAAEERARLELTSTIGGENTAVAQVRQQLASAENDVTETRVTAPCDGFVSNVNILPGQIVSPGSAVMPFVCDVDDESRGKIAATFPEGTYLGISRGSPAEVIFPMYPGLVFTAKVVDTIDITSGGQIPVGGVIPAITSSSNPPPRFAAILKLDDPNLRLPAGARGEAAVYSDRVPFAGVFRKGLIRTDTIVNYVMWGT
ncbi:biotin/lipoyl-binding protein [Rhodopseudomonas sp. BR0G17]|uniref:HlyD family secretion protein n=1 Tax=Rhodopseudomonas sp. BR0G17 TaxID=2269368 RepID=UPI0013E0435F|nr:biotin/lipoyl-binding protein [Rhodopseudomonas sp. BR0G17]NEW97139.1 HlyD family secretion protein [Rhodopseudomonas sp. BR0G17]